MALSAHLTELTEKHRSLDRKIQDELAKPASDEVKIARWKHEKLKIKDRISRLAAQTQH